MSIMRKTEIDLKFEGSAFVFTKLKMDKLKYRKIGLFN